MKASRPAGRAKPNFSPPTQIFVWYRAEGQALFGTLHGSTMIKALINDLTLIDMSFKKSCIR